VSFRITREVLDHAPAGLTPGARMVLTVLADIADDTRVCWPGRQTLVHRSGYTARTVRRALAELEKAGLITRGPGLAGAAPGRGRGDDSSALRSDER
jgi:DNA-binding MarR family transcriptional regulator